MIFFKLTLLMPFIGMIFLMIIRSPRLTAMINLIFSIITFAVSIGLAAYFLQKGSLLFWNDQIYVDAFSICFIVLTTFISMVVSYFSLNYMQHNLEQGRINIKLLRLYYILYQGFIGSMLLVLLSNNIGILWVAMEGATLSTVLLVSLYRTPESIEAAWKYFILCIVGIALALFGTVCVYFSARNVIPNQTNAMLWTVLYQYAKDLNPEVLKIAFVFLLVGYGTKIGLVPLHYWLPDAHSESPAPISALLSGLLLNMGVYALVRFKVLVDPALANHLAGKLMMGFGFLSFLMGGLFLFRQRNIKRMFSYSSVEHLGLITFAFGMGTALSTFVGLFYMMMHSLIKSAIFMSVGNVIQMTKTQDMDKIRGLIQIQPTVGWLLLISIIAISGFPPFGIFNSELSLLLLTIKQNIILAILLVMGLVVALAALLRNLHPVLYGKATIEPYTSSVCLLPIILNLSLALGFSLYLPHYLLVCFNQATLLITGSGILS